jgi:hypothetical protein
MTEAQQETVTAAAEQGLAEALQSIQVESPGTVSDEVLPYTDYGTYPEDPVEVPNKDADAKAGPPKLGEWQDFFSRIVIKYGTNWYMDMMLRDIDPALLKPSDLAALSLSADDRKKIARPFAELATKSAVAKKYGRTIVSSADSVESAMILAKWARTVSRIGKKYRPAKQPKAVRTQQHQHSQQVVPSQNGHGSANGNLGSGTVPVGNPIVIDGFAGN